MYVQENILISDSGDAVLCDFGLSRILGAEGFTTENAVCSARWTARERFEDQLWTCKSDIWSFGMTVLEVLHGVPFSNAYY